MSQRVSSGHRNKGTRGGTGTSPRKAGLTARWIFWAAYSMYAMSLVVCLLILDRYTPVWEGHRIFAPLLCILCGALGTGGSVIMGTVDRKRTGLVRRIVVTLGIVAWIYPLIIWMNGSLDRGTPRVEQVPVIDKSVSRKRGGTSRYLHIELRSGDRNHLYRLKVNNQEYEAAARGDMVRAVLSPGALGIDWIAEAGLEWDRPKQDSGSRERDERQVQDMGPVRKID